VSDSPADDVELLHRAAAGDDVAFAHFVTRHQAGVWRRAQALTGVDADAEDVLQETFLHAWRGAATFRGGSARAWLLTIASHAWQRMDRRGRRETATDDMETLESLGLKAGWGTDPRLADRAEAVEAALARLTADDQRILTLRDMEGLSGEETAALLGLSLQATKSRLHRARLRLAAAWKEVTA
jgi:RNA polymerase sigma-70 factor (ECF subfamily)